MGSVPRRGVVRRRSRTRHAEGGFLASHRTIGALVQAEARETLAARRATIRSGMDRGIAYDDTESASSDLPADYQGHDRDEHLRGKRRARRLARHHGLRRQQRTTHADGRIGDAHVLRDHVRSVCAADQRHRLGEHRDARRRVGPHWLGWSETLGSHAGSLDGHGRRAGGDAGGDRAANRDRDGDHVFRCGGACGRGRRRPADGARGASARHSRSSAPGRTGGDNAWHALPRAEEPLQGRHGY